MIHKFFCTAPSCVWLTADHVCSWTTCPEDKRFTFVGDIEQYKDFLKHNKPPVASVIAFPKRLPTAKSRAGKAVIGTDCHGVQFPYPTVKAAAEAHKGAPSMISKALHTDGRCWGKTWRYAPKAN